MTKYIDIFEEIVDIVHHDYAGGEEKQGWDHPEFYFDNIKDLEGKQRITPLIFVELVSDYLLSYEDPHMYFNLEGSNNVKTTRGFQTRRYKQYLYVIDTNEEKRFVKGDKIISIDNQTIEELAASDSHLLGGTCAEREEWSHIINKSSYIEIEKENGQQYKFVLKDYEHVPQKKEPSLETINEDTLLMVLPSFVDVEGTLAFVEKQKGPLKECTNLIIDVRNNHGGNGQACSTLLQYVFPRGERPSTENELREFNYTERNSDLFIQLCQNLRKNIKDEATLEMLDFAEEDSEKYRGQGFVTLDFTDSLEEEASRIDGTDTPENVIVITDTYCASAAEYFVETCMESSKVTVIGRSTMGVNDYSDLVIKKWNDTFALYYPISRRVHKTVNDPLHGKGIQPHCYIPWTPKHIHKDKDLIKALDILQKKINN